MTDYDGPGEGWREVDDYYNQSALLEQNVDGNIVRAWVQKESVPPLPTEPYTVIRVTWRGAEGVYRECVFEGGKWIPIGQDPAKFLEPEYIAERITGFEVLAEPHAVTATSVRKEVFAAVQEELLVDPYANWTNPVSKKQRHYGKGFVSGRNNALSIVARHTKAVQP